MRSNAVAISFLLFGIALIMVGNGLLGTLLGLRLTLAETPSVVTGMVMAAYFAGLAAGALGGIKLIVAVGHIRAFAAFASVYSAAALMHALYVEEIFWGALRFTQGACMAGLFLCAESWLNEKATNTTRGQIMSLYMIVLYLSQAAGQFLLLAASPENFVLFAAVSAIASLGVVPIALTRLPQPAAPSGAHLPFRSLYRLSPLAIVGSVTSGLILGAFYGMGPAYAPLSGLDTDATARFMSVAIIGGLGMQWPIGLLSDRIDRRWVILMVSVLIAAISLGLATVTEPSATMLLFMTAVFGAFAFALYPLSVTHANDHADGTSFVGIAGGLLLAYSLGATIGPVLAAVLMTIMGAGGLFLFIGVVAAFAAAFSYWRMRKRAPVPDDEKTLFAALPRTMPAIPETDPPHTQ